MKDRPLVDAEGICLALDLAPLEIVEIFDREAVRLLRSLANSIESGEAYVSIEHALERIQHTVWIGEAFSIVWERENPDEIGGDEERPSQEATRLGIAPAASSHDTESSER